MVETSQSYSLEDGQLTILGTLCDNCQHCWFPGVEFGCERCGSYGNSLTSKAFSAKGCLISFADILPDTEKAFTLATIELDKGPVIRGILGSGADLNGAGGNGVEKLKRGDSVVGRLETIDNRPVIRFYTDSSTVV